MKRMMAIATMALVAAAWFVPARADQPAVRSAQSDCQRELSRRGYTVLSTRNFQQYKDGWSLELQARDYKGRTTWGNCYVETRTGDVSLYGFGWGGSGDWGGGGNNGNQPFTFYCASPDYKYRECQLPVNGRARLTKKKSDAPCVEGRDWGQRGDRVWIDHGCRANFEVVRGGGGGGGNNGQQQRAEAQCRNEAQRQGLKVQSVSTPRPQGSYWEATVYGMKNGWKLQARCRYYPATNQAELRFNN
ncbi:MAG: DUF3011 domain-containing protein [Steroidobacteraceae bacterium]